MRIDLSNTQINTLIQKVALHPSFSDSNYEYAYDTISQSLVRSDITVNPVVSGWRKPSPYQATVEEHQPGFVTINCEETGYFKYYQSYDVPLPGISSYALEQLMPSDFMVAQVLTAALNNVADRKGSFVESAAEALKSAQGLADNASSISDFLFSAARKDWKGVAKSLGIKPRSRKHRRAVKRTVDAGGSLGAAWLNFWFGLSPIVSDMVSVAVFLSDENVLNTLRVNGRSSQSFNRVEETFEDLRGGELSSCAFVVQGDTSHVSRVCVSLDYTIDSTSLRRLATFGAVDVPSTIWAIQPYSFLVDWVLPVSALLKAYTADAFLTFRGGSLTKSALYEARILRYIPTPGSHLSLKAFDAVPGAYKGLIVDRTVYKSSPKPLLLRPQDPLGLWKGITSLSLLATRLKSSFG